VSSWVDVAPIRSDGRIVIAGAGIAGVRTAEQLRRQGFGGEVVVIGAEPHRPYDRPPLSKQYLRGGHEPTWLREEEVLAELEIRICLAEVAVSLAPAERILTTDRRRWEYDVVVIATGARPHRVPGLDGLVLRSLDDAQQLRNELHRSRAVGIVGAGLIGCELAATARDLDLEVHLVDVASGPATRVLGPVVADLLSRIHAEHGVHMHLGMGARRVVPDRLLLDDGSDIGVDLVVEAVGTAPETTWLRDSGLHINDGVECNEHGQAAPGVFAVGDVARWAGHRSEHWTAAGEQADHVAAQVVGAALPRGATPYWWSDQYDLRLQGLGRPRPDDKVHLLEWGPRARPVALYSRGGRLTGAVGFSAAGCVMGLRDDIDHAVPVQEIARRIAG
jgi:3-phenylpropionate/trans-cinnamate dioxygenase ferredoxin reductase component